MIIKYKGQTLEAAAHEEAYSTEETRIGTWIDGKPLYRKIVEGKTSPLYDTRVVIDSKLTYSYVDTLVSLVGSSKRSAAQTFVPLNVSLAENVESLLWIRSDGLNMQISEDFGSGHYFYVIVEYTKTAD